MPKTVEAIYHDGIVELKQKPVGIRKSRALVIFLDTEETEGHPVVNLERVSKGESSVDKWIGVIEGVRLGDWRAERRAAIEGKPREDSH
ncbi:hypothetical protein [Geoalkalibacter halelectricus]|uniref:hypothetical protein n=1 Tax=Geoalkalibacter halelectricus TaxID=2847045 RepID=UPI003D234D80